MARVEMKDMLGSSRRLADQGSPTLTGITVTVEAARQQTLSEQGLKLDVAIRNNGRQPLVMEDPGEFIHIQLLDSRGYPVDLPSVPTGRFLCRGPSESDLRTGNSDPSSEIDVRKSFELVRPKAPQTAKSGDKPSPSEPRLEAGRLILPAGKEYRLTLQIRKILADPVGYVAAQKERARTPVDSTAPAAAPPAAIAIPPGQYSVRVQIALVPPAGSEAARQLQSEPVAVDIASPATKPQTAP